MMIEQMFRMHERWGRSRGEGESFGGREGVGRERLDYWEIPKREGRSSNCRKTGGT